MLTDTYRYFYILVSSRAPLPSGHLANIHEKFLALDTIANESLSAFGSDVE